MENFIIYFSCFISIVCICVLIVKLYDYLSANDKFPNNPIVMFLLMLGSIPGYNLLILTAILICFTTSIIIDIFEFIRKKNIDKRMNLGFYRL